MYNRVLPRDLFNEAKLLKCLGQLALKIHDCKAQNTEIMHTPDEGFEIGQRDHDGGLTVTNMEIIIHRRRVDFFTSYNCRDNYPLYVEYEDEEARVFDENGHFSDDYIHFCKELAAK
jgi:hypothetical protein